MIRFTAASLAAGSRSSRRQGTDKFVSSLCRAGWGEGWHDHQASREASGWAFWSRGRGSEDPEPSGTERALEAEPAGPTEEPSTSAGSGALLQQGEGALDSTLDLGSASAAASAAAAVAADPSGAPGPMTASAAWVVEAVHTGTGLPWWATLAATGAATRFALLPLGLQQGHSIRSNLKLWSQAQSEASTSRMQQGAGSPGSKPQLRDIWTRFTALREAEGQAPLPSLWWIPAAPVIQVTVFATNALAIRSLAAGGGAPGFASEGALWFPDLTQPAMILSQNAAPMGIAGALLPFAVVTVYLSNINRAFGDIPTAVVSAGGAQQPAAEEDRSVMAWLRPHIRLALEWLCVGILWVSLQQPQGLLLYVLSSATFALVQHTPYGQALVRRSFGWMVPQQGREHQPRPGGALPSATGDGELLTDGSSGLDGHVVALFTEAAERRAQGDVQGAIEVLHRLISLEPHQAQAFFALGKLYSSQKQWSASEAAFMRSVELEEPGPQQGRAFFGAGLALYNQGEYDTAADALMKALDKFPEDAEIWLALSGALSKDARPEEARAAVLKAAELDPAVKEHLMAGLIADVEKVGAAEEAAADETDTSSENDVDQSVPRGGVDVAAPSSSAPGVESAANK